LLAALSDVEFRLLRDAIADRFGIHYDDGKQFLLQSRLQGRLLKRSVADFGAYYRFLSTNPARELEWDELASVLTNNETYFFRERAQLEVLGAEVVDEWLRRPAGALSVWSAACSTGEEPYSLAIALLEGRRLSPVQIRIKAGDLSPRALERCAAGFYREISLRAAPPELVSKYFQPTSSGGFRIVAEVKRMVEFFRINLLDAEAVARAGPVDAVFCRNVLIYFERATQRRVVDLFAAALRPGGFLFLGHVESMLRLSDRYERFVTPKATYFRLKR
jgi:chemotaxis protein methyltransferase CheR